ncbi:hypothetical protein V6N13_024959 [Hibiscus sabdariffa]
MLVILGGKFGSSQYLNRIVPSLRLFVEENIVVGSRMYVESILTASVNQTGLGLSRALATTYVALWKASGPNCIKISVDRAMDECNGVSSIGGVLQSSVGK